MFHVPVGLPHRIERVVIGALEVASGRPVREVGQLGDHALHVGDRVFPLWRAVRVLAIGTRSSSLPRRSL
jgi:hypothetical protein